MSTKGNWILSKVFKLNQLVFLAYEYITTEIKGEKNNVGLVTLNRPKALNALCGGLMNEVVEALKSFDTDKNIAAMVLTGSEKAFAGWYYLIN